MIKCILPIKSSEMLGEKTQCSEKLTFASLTYLEIILSLPYIL